MSDKFVLYNVPVQFTNRCNYLGILLDKTMSLMPMITRVKNLTLNKIYSLAKIRDCITLKCALTIYKQTILPLFDYSGFVLISCNISDRLELQKLQNDALRICYNVKLRDCVSVRRMHVDARLLSLEQRRQVQLLSLMYMYKDRHEDVRIIYNRRTRAAEQYNFVSERYIM